jgi:1-acyl-sn-glycerol-3-phosphate acyltransferase
MSSEPATAALPRKGRFVVGTGIVNRASPTMRHAILAVGRGVGNLFLSVTVTGKANLPQPDEPLIVISNHFGWFDGFILTLFLPFQPVFLVATESQRKWYVRFFMKLFDGIPVWRGQVDRDAFRSAQDALKQGRSIGVFPEGGIRPDLVERAARGEQITQQKGPTAREDGALVRAKSGAALLATMSPNRILPIALRGSERIGVNLRHLRRTRVTINIGPVFGPLELTPGERGVQRRESLDKLTDEMMGHIARMFPPDKRGPYAVSDL